ncbi:uncharacterized protein LOC120690715 [Panicum virgatum]|uniref:Uncharacterized protein n=1 Tax=Panicum virgatum TaxID=38727 RepID=A0A8T0MKA1_PANVG|nr:uncharacterized protein LOC120690715 [Panicum virgatum]KAG2537178.1 hypothetical protein PVAP13_9NG253300 [Panicum virgatum]
MTPASMVAMPRSVPAAVAAFPASARAEERRKTRPALSRTAACGGDEQQPPSMAAVPPSLRAIQARRKQAAAQRGVPRATATSAAGCAVAALVKAVEAVQGAAAGGASEAARGAGDAVAWVFSKVHFQSPDLAVGLLGMVACCLGTAVQAERDRMEARRLEALRNAEAEPDDDDGDAEEPEDLPELVEGDMEKELWSRIGILHGGGLNGDGQEDLDEEEIKEIDSARARRRKAAYERIIASGGANSLVLSNYAQLLYELDKDINRAEMYFKQAVAAEPADGEAMRRYGMFLWHARGDIGGAEEMFTGAIDEEPESSHHRSSYAWFLWMTGGVETCLIDTGKNNGNDAE